MNKRLSFRTHLLVAGLFAAGIGMPMAALANTGHDHGHGHGQAHAPSAKTMADGMVKKVDRQAGRVTISHGPLPNGMPAMTMVFKPLDAEWLGKLREGEKIRFTAEDRQGVMTLTQFETIK